ncbi:MAG: kelch repeat-containing protein [Phycisphaerales bacterium]
MLQFVGFRSVVRTSTLFVALVASWLLAISAAVAQCGLGWTLGAGDGPGSYEICYDEARGKTVLFGGTATYEWDGVSWTTVAVSGPPERGAGAMVYDPIGQRCLLFGGYSSAGPRKDLWSWDGKAWSELGSAPAEAAGRGDFAMTFDRGRNRLVIHGGWPGSGLLLTDTLEWNPENGTWQRWATSPIGNRYAHRMAYDEARREVILHGGYYFTNKNDTWRWNGAEWTLASTSGPARYVFGMTYDSARSQIVLHGGTTCCGEVEYPQTWIWNGAAWTLCEMQGPARGYMNIAYDRVRDVIVLPGGMGPTAAGRAYVPETWELAMSAQPNVLHVPLEHPTIQSAVDAATPGDTVLVAPGTYDESVDIRGKAIVIKSDVPGGATVRAPLDSRSFVAGSGETSSTRVIGFRLTRQADWGGGVLIVNSSPVFDSCRFDDCRNHTGGGVLASGGAASLIACDFTSCFVDGAGGGLYGGGGAIRAIGASLTIDRCSVLQTYGGQGAIMMQEGGGASVLRKCAFSGVEGIYATWFYNAFSTVTIEDSVFDSLHGTTLFGWAPYTVRRCQFRNITGDRVMEMRYGQNLIDSCLFERCQVSGYLFGVIYSGSYAIGNSSICSSSTPLFQGPWVDLGGNDFNAGCSCFGDIDGNGEVGASDLTFVLYGWQRGPGYNGADLSGDGETDGVDVALLLANWGVCK